MRVNPYRVTPCRSSSRLRARSGRRAAAHGVQARTPAEPTHTRAAPTLAEPRRTAPSEWTGLPLRAPSGRPKDTGRLGAVNANASERSIQISDVSESMKDRSHTAAEGRDSAGA